MDDVSIREILDQDIPIFFEQQLDPQAHQMVAFCPRAPDDKEAILAHWVKIRADETNMKMTIIYKEQVAGYLVCFDRTGKREVGYWLGKDFWSKGIATKALRQFLKTLKMRPLYGVCAKDNLASIRVLENCGFIVSGHDKGFSKIRGQEVDQLVLILN